MSATTARGCRRAWGRRGPTAPPAPGAASGRRGWSAARSSGWGARWYGRPAGARVAVARRRCRRLAPGRPLGRGVLQPRAEAVALEARPELEEALVQQLAPGLQVDRERLEPAPRPRVRGPRRVPRVEVVGLGGHAVADGTRVGGPQLLDPRLDARQLDVAVVDLAEQVLELLDALERGVGVRAEARLGRHLEHVAQALRGDAHVVERGDLLRMERLGDERLQLVEPDADDPLGVVGERAVGLEALDLARLLVVGALLAAASASATAAATGSGSGAGAVALAASSARRPRRSVDTACSSACASVSLPRACSSRTGAANASIPGASALGSTPSRSARRSRRTSGSRRAPSASASALTSFRSGRYSAFGKHGA